MLIIRETYRFIGTWRWRDSTLVRCRSSRRREISKLEISRGANRDTLGKRNPPFPFIHCTYGTTAADAFAIIIPITGTAAA